MIAAILALVPGFAQSENYLTSAEAFRASSQAGAVLNGLVGAVQLSAASEGVRAIFNSGPCAHRHLHGQPNPTGIPMREIEQILAIAERLAALRTGQASSPYGG